MGKPIAVQGFTIQINGGVIVSAVPLVPTTPPDSSILVNNKPAYFGDLSITVAGTTGPAGTQVDPVNVTINATGTSVSNQTGAAVLLGDKNNIPVTANYSSGSTTTPVPLTLIITDAGQTDVLID